MIEALLNAQPTDFSQYHAHKVPTKALAHRAYDITHNERTAGSIPVWGTKTDAQNTTSVEAALGDALNGTPENSNTTSALSYNPEAQETTQTDIEAKPFGFADLLDMINPLHHIPVLGSAYREFTGDQIRPVGQIIGSTFFGGPAGAGISMVNMIVEHETGRDLTQNAFAKLGIYESKTEPRLPDRPEARLAALEASAHYGDTKTNTSTDFIESLLAAPRRSFSLNA